MINPSELELTSEDHEKAFTEVSFLLDMLVKATEVFVGKGSPSLAIAAGRNMAKNLPVHLSDPSPEKALEEVVRVLSIRLGMSGRFDGEKAVISLKKCPIRDVCSERGIPIDGQACQMFHFYIAGIMSSLTGRPSRPATMETGEECSFSLSFGASHSTQ